MGYCVFRFRHPRIGLLPGSLIGGLPEHSGLSPFSLWIFDEYSFYHHFSQDAVDGIATIRCLEDIPMLDHHCFDVAMDKVPANEQSRLSDGGFQPDVPTGWPGRFAYDFFGWDARETAEDEAPGLEVLGVPEELFSIFEHSDLMGYYLGRIYFGHGSPLSRPQI
jgi:hypothetical protein